VRHRGLRVARVPRQHTARLALLAGFEPGHGLQEADLGLLLDVDVPWLPQFANGESRARAGCRSTWTAVKKDFPMWGFPADVRVQGDCATVLGQVLEIVRGQADPAFRARVGVRHEATGSSAAETRGERRPQPRLDPASPERSPSITCARRSTGDRAGDHRHQTRAYERAPGDDQIRAQRPLTMFGNGGSGLGFSGGMALGVKLARPNQRVVQIVGDGSFHFLGAGCRLFGFAGVRPADLHGRAGQRRLGCRESVHAAGYPRASRRKPTTSTRAWQRADASSKSRRLSARTAPR
jgi:thiamine pyrophosphate-dependent acetolactate synthase large subunit-like protein